MADFAEIFAAARFSLWAELEVRGSSKPTKVTDVVAVSATFALNTIPTASIVFALGRNTLSAEKASIHDVREKMPPRAKIDVYVTVIAGEAGNQKKIKPGTYKIFSGFVTGAGYQRAHNHANFVLNAVHWLDDLNNSTAINGDWFVGAPADYARSALIENIQIGGIRAFGPVPQMGVGISELRTIEEDLWEKSIKAGFKELAGLDPVSGTSLNSAAINALNKMPGAGINFYKPLAFNLPDSADASAAQISDAFSNYYTKALTDSTAQNSFWAKLITNFAADFLFAVSPAVDWALPIPFCAGVRWQPAPADAQFAVEIDATEYNYASITTNQSQVIEAIHIVYPQAATTGLIPPELVDQIPERLAAGLPFYRLYASYPPAEAITAERQERGLKLFKQPPVWIGLGDDAGISGWASAKNSTTVGVRPATTKLETYVTETYAQYAKNADLVQKFAVHWYCNEVLQQRTGELSGALRFDIAPGSIVKIKTPTQDITQGYKSAEYVTASVMAVSYVINAERATAGTSFTVAHTKWPHEERESFFSVPAPPLYKNAFYGGPLSIPK